MAPQCTLFVEPVKSVKCSHVFSKAAILELLKAQRGGEIECPQAHCPQYLRLQDLQTDRQMERLVTKEKRRLERNSRPDEDEYVSL